MPFKEGTLPVRYLGVPLIFKRLFVKDCHVLIDKARKRILDWKDKSLSFAGRLQLIKSVISSMQVYWASMFILPVSISIDIEKMMRDFLWNFRVFKRESLWVRWVNTYRLKGRSFWDIPKKKGSCWAWKKILKIRGLIKEHIFHKIGDGRNTSLWFDNWHPICPLSNFISKRMIASSGLNLQSKVADVIFNGEWNWPVNLSNMFDALNVISPPCITEGKNDKVVWKFCNGGFLDFSVLNVWGNIRIRGNLTQDNMLHGDRNLRLLCTFCGKVADSHDHLFFDCNFPNSIWVLLKNMVRLDNAPNRNVNLDSFKTGTGVRKIYVILSKIWFFRTTTFLPLRHVSLFMLFMLCTVLYPFTERYAQPYFFSCLIRQISLALQGSQTDSSLFADDLLLFSNGDSKSVSVMKKALSEFLGMSGLLPNCSKSTVFFGNVRDGCRRNFLDIMPFKEGSLTVRYLGVPLISKRLFIKDCHVLIDKARKRILDWKNKSLSFAGRLQLIKSVISSMQVYWASMFILPVSISNDIEKLMRDFLWNFGVFKRGKSLINWKSVCKMKVKGGLGIKSLDSWNIALMSKHIWNVITNKESMWVRWVNTYRLKEGSCWAWKKILKIRGLIKEHIFHKIGDGRNTSLWFDNWHPICPLSNFISKRMIASSGLNLQNKVADVIKNGEWNWPVNLSNMFDALNVISPPCITEGRNDKVVWKSCNGRFLDFSVSNVWENIRMRGTLVSWSNLVWFSQCIPHHSFFLWLAMHGKLKTQDNMLHGDRNNRLLCTFCGKVADSHDHLFFDCNFPNGIWDSLKNMVRLDNALNRNVILDSFKTGTGVYEAANIWSFHVCNDIRIPAAGFIFSPMIWAFYHFCMKTLGFVLIFVTGRASIFCIWNGVQIVLMGLVLKLKKYKYSLFVARLYCNKSRYCNMMLFFVLLPKHVLGMSYLLTSMGLSI
nr:hypothetical protein [Tanacetum cinerariifolium]